MINSQSFTSFSQIINQRKKRKQNLIILRAPTGSGKSTFYIKNLFEHGFIIFLVAPTIASVQNLHSYMSKSVDDPNNVGYAADSEIHYSNSILNTIKNKNCTEENSKIVYCTGGHMKNLLYDVIRYLNSQNDITTVKFCDEIVLDEIHLGTIDITMIYRLWITIKNILSGSNISFPNLTLASATYYDESIPTYELETNKKKWKVDIFYLSQKPKNFEEIYESIIGTLEGLENNQNKPSGVWLVFLPGLPEIERIKRRLSYYKFDIHIAHSSISNEEMNKIFEPPRGKRKLILSTNIAETSLTIKNLSLIIDSMLEKVPEITASGSLVLNNIKISKDSAQQRKGRTGRTCNGEVYRMCTFEEFEQLEQTRSLEIERQPIINEAIRCMSVGIHLHSIFGDLPDIKINECLCLLQKMNAIDNNKNVTSIGQFVTTIPFSFRTAIFLYHWNLSNNMYFGIVLAMLIEMSDSLTSELSSSLKSDIPLGCLLNIWINMITEYNTFNPTNDQINEYCLKYNLKFLFIKELKKNIDKLLVIFRCHNRIDINVINISEIYKQAYPILKNIYPRYKYAKKNKFLKEGTTSPFFILDKKFFEFPTNEVIGIYSKKINNVETLILWIPYTR